MIKKNCMVKKITLCVMLITFFPFITFARKREVQSEWQCDKISKSIYVELFGASNLVGVSYDARLGAATNWGYRIGVSYTSDLNSLFDNSSSMRGVSIPLEMNYLLGRKKSKLDLGLGINLGFYTEKISYTEYSYEMVDEMMILIPIQDVNLSKRLFGYYLFSNIGYRFQAVKGFQFRVGISPSLNLGGVHGVKKHPSIYPYLSFGYSF